VDQGVRPDQPVGICVHRSLEMVIGLLGILKAGGAYVPLDPGYPAERLQYMLQDLEPQVLLTQQPLRGDLPATQARIVALDAEWDRMEGYACENLNSQAIGVNDRHLAYVIYTSGSTGRPKGAMNEHRGVVNRLQWMQEAYRLGAQDRVLQKTPFSFDVSVWEFFWTLLQGARLVLAPPESHKDPQCLKGLIQGSGITRVHFVPSMLQSFLEQLRAGECSSLQQVVCSGEELGVGLQSRCLQVLPRVRLSNLYGPTEAAVDVTAWECDGQERSRIPIGRPIANSRIYVLDGRGQPVPLGVEGEIYIGGVGVGRGYWRRPQLTAERFVRDPFVSEAGARMYRTGDVGRYLPDGNVEYLGRNDQQVKVRGFRIELGEIEARLQEQPGIGAAVVLAREDMAGDKRLVAYYTLKEGELAVPDVASMRSRLSESLPEYMVPAAYVQLEALPLTPNGKLDRRALPAPEASAYGASAYEAPVGKIETTLAQIWSEVLQIERVGRQDHFFELGGHSLLAVQLMERMRKQALHADVRTLMTEPTLAAFAAKTRKVKEVLL
jgi:arthrofactin-type cyclic lipopeptide synthetase C